MLFLSESIKENSNLTELLISHNKYKEGAGLYIGSLIGRLKCLSYISIGIFIIFIL